MTHPAETTGTLVDYPEPDYSLISSPLMAGAIRRALADVRAGVREVPEGSNRGPRVDELLVGPEKRLDLLCYDRYATPAGKLNPCHYCALVDAPTDQCRGCPWCGRGARTWILEECLATATLAPFPSHLSLASAAKWRDWAEGAGRWRDARSFPPQPGWVGLLGTGRKSGHVTLIYLVRDPPTNPARSIRCVSAEGNHDHRAAVAERPWSEYDGGVVI